MLDFLNAHRTLTQILFASLLLLMLIGAIFFAHKFEVTKTRSEKIKKYATVAIFSALSIGLYYLRIPFPVFTFLKMQLSSVPAYIVGFLLGPASGLMVIFIRTAICIPFTSTICVGELADLLIGTAATLTSSLYYLKNKTKTKAAISLTLASVVWVLTAILANVVLLLPFYIRLMFNGNEVAFVNMLASSASFINENNYVLMYVLVGVIPFNLMISIVSAVVTFLIYKRISKLYRNIAKEDNNSDLVEDLIDK